MASKFSHKHYEEVAKLFDNFSIIGGRSINREIKLLRLVISDFANMFEKDNEKFDRARFIKACGNWQEK